MKADMSAVRSDGLPKLLSAGRQVRNGRDLPRRDLLWRSQPGEIAFHNLDFSHGGIELLTLFSCLIVRAVFTPSPAAEKTKCGAIAPYGQSKNKECSVAESNKSVVLRRATIGYRSDAHAASQL